MFASVNIWASVSCRKWLQKTQTLHTTRFSSCSRKRHIYLPNLPRFSAVVHHRQDTTGWFKYHHSVFISWRKQDENKLKQKTNSYVIRKLKIALERTHFFFFFLMYLSWAYSVLSLNVELLLISCCMISCELHPFILSNGKNHAKFLKSYEKAIFSKLKKASRMFTIGTPDPHRREIWCSQN